MEPGFARWRGFPQAECSEAERSSRGRSGHAGVLSARCRSGGGPKYAGVGWVGDVTERRGGGQTRTGGRYRKGGPSAAYAAGALLCTHSGWVCPLVLTGENRAGPRRRRTRSRLGRQAKAAEAGSLAVLGRGLPKVRATACGCGPRPLRQQRSGRVIDLPEQGTADAVTADLLREQSAAVRTRGGWSSTAGDG